MKLNLNLIYSIIIIIIFALDYTWAESRVLKIIIHVKQHELEQ
jgi:hypothetical protein